jgi:uncharacterized protein
LFSCIKPAIFQASSFIMKSRALVLFALILPMLAWADYKDGLKAADNGDYLVALQHWQPLAAQGNAPSQYNLALMYDRGLGLPHNSELAARWYEKAASQGHAAAQNHLGSLYENGEGVVRDLAKARYWYQRAAAKHNVWAEDNLKRLATAGR